MLLRKGLVASALGASALAQTTVPIKPSASELVGTDVRTDAWPNSRPWDPPISVVGNHLFPTVTHVMELPPGMIDCVPKDVLSSMNGGEVDMITVTEISTSTFYVLQPTLVHPANATFTVTQNFVEAAGQMVSVTAPLQVNDGTTFGSPQAVLTPAGVGSESGVSTVFMADFGDTTIPVTRPTTITHHGTAFPFPVSTPSPMILMDPAMFVTRLRPNVPVPDSCHKRKDKNGTQCHIDQCMQKHTRPVEINTIMVAAMLDLSAGTMIQDYFTQHTTLETPHWGVTKTNGTYWPITTMSGLDRDNLPSTYATHHSHTLQCYDPSSCYLSCAKEADEKSGKKKLITAIAGAVVGFLALVTLILFCLRCFHRRYHRDTRKGPLVRRSSTDLGPSPSPVSEVVETTGNGTLGRRAEEGRGRVRFDKQAPGAGQAVQNAPGAGAIGQGAGAMGQNAGQGVGAAGEKVAQGAGRGAEKVVVTSKAAPAAVEKVVEKPAIATTQAAEHVEAVPGHDGADSSHTGSMAVDNGSMRGRRRVRPDGQPI